MRLAILGMLLLAGFGVPGERKSGPQVGSTLPGPFEWDIERLAAALEEVTA